MSSQIAVAAHGCSPLEGIAGRSRAGIELQPDPSGSGFLFAQKRLTPTGARRVRDTAMTHVWTAPGLQA